MDNGQRRQGRIPYPPEIPTVINNISYGGKTCFADRPEAGPYAQVFGLP